MEEKNIFCIINKKIIKRNTTNAKNEVDVETIKSSKFNETIYELLRNQFAITKKKVNCKTIKKKSSGYALNGAIYAAETSYFKKTRSFFTKKTLIFPMPASRSVDIDTFEDFNMAKSKFKNK